jgi:hypothetical protein
LTTGAKTVLQGIARGEIKSGPGYRVTGQYLVETKWCSMKKNLLEAKSLSSYVRIKIE